MKIEVPVMPKVDQVSWVQTPIGADLFSIGMSNTRSTIDIYNHIRHCGVRLFHQRGCLVARPSENLTDEMQSLIIAHEPELLGVIRNIQSLPLVKLHKVPRWLRNLIFEANRQGRIKCRFKSWSSSIVFGNACSKFLFKDHWGTDSNGDFVCEPYRQFDDVDLVESVRIFCETFGTIATIQPESAWNPGLTCRVTFRRPQQSEDRAAQVRRHVKAI